jgi:hypothetical protein
MTAPTFRFLDLPKELRLMVYECIPIITHHHVLQDPTIPEDSSSCGSTITLVVKSISIAMLLASSPIYDECRPIFDHKLKALRAEPLRLIVDSTSWESMRAYPKTRSINRWCTENFMFPARNDHSHCWEGKEFKLARRVFTPKDPEFINIIKFMGTITRLRKTRLPSSSIIAVRPKGSYSVTSDLADQIARAAIRPMLNVLPDPKWTLHASSPRVGLDGVNISDCIMNSFHQRESWAWPGATFIERVSPEEWTRDWEECASTTHPSKAPGQNLHLQIH